MPSQAAESCSKNATMKEIKSSPTQQHNWAPLQCCNYLKVSSSSSAVQ